MDVGTSATLRELIGGLRELGIEPRDIDYIFISHIHIDHAGGLGEFLHLAPQAKAIVHPQGIKHLIAPQKLWEASLKALGEIALKYGPIAPCAGERLVPAEEGMEIDLGGPLVRVLFTPGHAPHHLSFWEEREKALFIGEAGGVYHPEIDAPRPATPPPFDFEVMRSSLEKLSTLQARMILYGHTGSASGELRTLKRFEEQLSLWIQILSCALAQRKGEEEILEMLFREDEEIAKLKALPYEKMNRELFFLRNSLSGFLGYLSGSR